MAGRLSGWQNVPGGSPNATASFRYDGEGERVAQQSTTSGTTTTRYLLGGLEELTTSGATTTLTKYYSVPGVVTAIKVGTTLSYLATDGLGSVSVALSVAGSTTGQALYLPYGAGRYASGSMPTARGYTGQYQDATSGLDYYGARYYDAVLGQFTSADTVLAGGLNRYGYVGGNPTTATDPTGHNLIMDAEEGSAEDVIPATSAAAGGAAAAEAASGFNWLNVLRAFAAAGLAGVAWQAWSQPPRPTSLPTPDVVGSSGPAIHMGSTGWHPTTKPTPTTPTAPISNQSTRKTPTPKPTTPPTPAPTAPGPQPQPGGGGTPGGVPPTPGAGGTCGCDPGDDRPVNSKGVPYPSFIDPRTGGEIPFPKGPLSEVDPADRVDYDGAWDKHLYIKEWYDRGYPSLPGPWTQFEVHHILPRQFGGGNDFWNLVPLSHQDHLQYTNWWNHYCP